MFLLLTALLLLHKAALAQICNGTTEVLLPIENSTSGNCLPESETKREAVFAKCCPLNFAYDPLTHSCKKTESDRHFVQKFAFFKIGLRNCVNDAIVVDFVSDFNDLDLNQDGAAVLKTSTFKNGEFCVDGVYNSSDLIVVRVCSANLLEECGRNRKCLRKCCPDLEVYVDGRNCKARVDGVFDYNGWEKANRTVDGGDFSIIHGLSCRPYIANAYTQYNLDEWGNMNLLQINTWKHYKPYEEAYCIEHLIRNGSLPKDIVLMCMIPPSQKYNYTRVAMAISCFFILLTIVTYIWLLETNNVFSRAVVSYCVSLFGTFLLLTYVQWSEIENKVVCTGLAYAVTAFMLSTFVWMNALCIDIWLTFGSDSALMTMKEEWDDGKRFLLYSLYGWGLPVVIISLIAFFKHSNVLPNYLQPLFGDAKCLMYSERGNYSKLLLFVLPITALKICDVILFIRTSMYCIEVKNAITNMKDDNSSCDWKRRFLVDKERLTLLIKLFIIMGIPWLFEVLTSIFRFDLHPTLAIIENIWDIINCLQGVYVFIVFVCKRKVLDMLLKKTKLQRRKLSLSSAVTQSSIMVSRHCSGKR